MTTTNEIDEFTRLDRELNGISNALFDVDGEIKEACNDNKEVTEKIEDVYSAITDLQAAIDKYGKRKGKTEDNKETI